MSCNGCRVLRKGCSDSCVLRSCFEWIESPGAQAHATAFLAKFFGRTGLISFVSAVPESQRPDLFQSLLHEACGRTINPVNGAVGLLWSGNWHLCVAAVEMVLRGETLEPMIVPVELSGDDDVEGISVKKRPRGVPDGDHCDLDLSLKPTSAVTTAVEKKQPRSLSDGSVTTSVDSEHDGRPKLLKLH